MRKKPVFFTLSLCHFVTFLQEVLMKRVILSVTALSLAFLLSSSACAQSDSAAAPKPASKSAKVAKAEKSTPAAPAKTASVAKAGGDTLVIIARVTEIPGKFASNDLYNYVYIMKYRVLSVVKGAYKPQEILVGHYNPLIPRAQIKDAMKKNVAGNVEKFEVGGKQKLWLVTPIDKVWKDAVDDEYSDSDLGKYYALKADIAQ
jgi:hypothetical protein